MEPLWSIFSAGSLKRSKSDKNLQKITPNLATTKDATYEILVCNLTLVYEQKKKFEIQLLLRNITRQNLDIY